MALDDLRGRRLGGFELIEPLGDGSYGTVWRARQLRLDRDVAVKVLDPLVARDPVAARRFEREGRAAASLDHPSIVPVYEAGDDDGLYYLAMRLVDGESLAEVIDAEAPLPRERVVDLLAPIAAALDAAHATGLVHRDVKPANILIEDGRPYLSDFGIAASAREMGRYTTGSLGTAEYMAPEQGRGDDVDHRADLYALACVAYHALTGVSPFARDDVVATLLAHANDPVPPTGSPDLDAFFERALAKDREQRFPTATALIASLPGSGLDPDRTSGPDPDQNGRRWGTGVGAVSVVLVVLVVLAAVLWWSGRDEPGDDGEVAADGTVAATSAPTEVTAPETSVAATAAPATTAPASSPPGTDPDGGDDSGDDATGGAGVVDGGSVVVGTTLQLDDPNPHSNRGAAAVLSEWVLPVMYRIDANLDPVPSLAAGPPVADADDPLTLTWTIRDDRVWDDGTPVTSADLVATFEYLTADDTNATNLLLYEPVVAVEPVDDTTVRIELSEPHGGAYLMFSTIHPLVSAGAWEEHLDAGGTAADFLTDGVDFAAGPYRLTSRRNAGELALGPNPAWTGSDEPALERIDVVTYPDGESLVQARSLQEVDVIWVDEVGRDEYLTATELDGTRTELGTSSVAVQLTFNARTPALTDARVRRAVMHAIDRDAIADIAVGSRTGTVADTWDSLVFAPDQRGNAQPFDGRHDPVEAARLLDEAGWTRPGDDAGRTRDGQPLSLRLVLVGETDLTNTAVSIVNDLAELGVDVVGLSGTVDQTNDRVSTGDFDLLLQYRVFNSDPVAAELTFGTDGCPATVPGCEGAGVNVGAFSDPGVDDDLARADATTDLDERLAVFTAIDQDLAELVPAVPLFARPAFTAYDERIVGIELAPNIGPLVTLDDWAYTAD